MHGLVSSNGWRMVAFVWVCLVALISATLAQTAPKTQVVVRGQVLDPAGSVVAGAQVTSDCTWRLVVTDANGDFAVHCRTAPTHIQISHPGFKG
ncbi:MAG TPA: carboxypeptidase-like regulatory domain-containing protein, partial [Terriglobales bacterium]|nr:carboxypeptidase-like regulatory domain-containing protein [Terriglobales bacterium]